MLGSLRICRGISSKVRTFSGIQPTGKVHLGNYLGAVKSWADGLGEIGENGEEEVEEESRRKERREENIFCIVDLHAITLTPQKHLNRQIVEMCASLVASGIDPEKCILFQQSQVPQHCELSWILGTLVSTHTLSNLSQFKDKSKDLKEIPLGLLIYPVLQAADILLYKATKVPVGEDNLQNLERARDIVKAFNRVYKKDFFPKPIPILSPTSKIQSLRDPDKKMSKSDVDPKSCIYINDSPETINAKCKKAVTDNLGSITYDPENRPGISNLLRIQSSITGQSIDQVVSSVEDMKCGNYKIHFADVLIECLNPIREKYDYLMRNERDLMNLLEKGNHSARGIAEKTMIDVRRYVGFTK